MGNSDVGPGDSTSPEPQARRQGAIQSTLGYAGMFYHARSGLYLTHYRAYDPRLGRWLSRDPIWEAGGVNLYGYVGGDPISFIDPYGLARCTYSIASHILTCTPNSSGDSVVLGPNGVTSGDKGNPCQDNPSPSCIDDRNKGPIVPGNYNMNQDDRPGHKGFWRLEPNPKISGWKCLLRLKRCGFELHPGTISWGCITADRNNGDTMKQYESVNRLLNQENGDNQLTVVP